MQIPDEIEVEEVTLEDKEVEVDQELWYDAAQDAEGILPGWRMLPVQATITRGWVLRLADNVPSVLYWAIIAGGRREGLFLEVDANAEPVPPLKE